ncbi:putative integral membrane protein [Diplodia seriata]|uniref:Putative integral membrane protein n=1 Tax=Diplodia seriata TaxID=420778 RepID=A0A0G2DW03_9PEZI|nr:putative integral membrane protein [Diplodia seriata]
MHAYRSHFERTIHQVSPKSPGLNLSVLQTSVDGEGYYNAEVKCKSCRASGNEKNDGYEHWLWSANDYQTLRTDEVDAPLQMHTLYGRFETIVEQSPSGHLTRAGDRTSMGIKGPPASSKDLIRAHGALMLLAFLAIYPAGVLGILYGGKRAFWMHAGAQATATACVLVAGTFAIFAPPVHSRTGPLLLWHRVFGSAVLIVVVAQGGIGYMHHRTPLGYVVLLFGFANAAL